ncbi:MAG: CRISPR-associated endonuclease Cas2 [Chloroflexi bacterium]|nr:CRISPR-associated endonuclease Cas2 [Chloroflexota bacterium]
MRYLLVYDIPDDRIRTKVADFCLDYGLDRVQYSAFIGRLSRSLMDELVQKIQRKIGSQPAKILVVPIPNDAWRQRVEIVQEAEADD